MMVLEQDNWCSYIVTGDCGNSSPIWRPRVSRASEGSCALVVTHSNDHIEARYEGTSNKIEGLNKRR